MPATDRSLAARALVASSVLLCAAIMGFPVVEAFVAGAPSAWRVLVFSALTFAVLVGGGVVLWRRGSLTTRPATRLDAGPIVYLGAIGVPWAMVIVDTPHAAYFLIAMFVIALWLLPPVVGTIATLTLTALTIAGQVVHHGWAAGSVIGPTVAAALAIVFMSGYRSVVADSAEKSRLVDELRRAQDRLAASEREAGRLAERTRLGRDLHDTVAQSLSSIQLLLHAAERADDHATGMAYLRQAREAAGGSLAETRAFISDLTPPDLAQRSLATALDRVGGRARDRGLDTRVEVVGTPRPLSMALEATLLRVAQEAVENVLTHARAAVCTVTLRFEPDAVTLEIDDDGAGFDAEAALERAGAETGSFGLAGMRARTAELGGYTVVVSAPGDGTLVSARVPVDEPPRAAAARVTGIATEPAPEESRLP